MSFQTANYSDFLNDWASLVGVQVSDLSTVELTFANSFFNKNIRDIWERQNWVDICPYAEARFPTNLLAYPNDYTQASYWTSVAGGPYTSSGFPAFVAANPLDARVNAQMIYANNANTNHGVSQTITQTYGAYNTLISGTQFQVAFYARPAQTNYVYVQWSDAGAPAGVWSAYFNLATGVTGTTTAGATAGIQVLNNGWCYCTLSATQITTSGLNDALYIYASQNGSTTAFSGGSFGTYCFNLWGVTMTPTSSNVTQNFNIPFAQLGETAIDQVFDVWNTNPIGFDIGSRASYTLTSNGIQLISSTNANPVYLYYRQRRPLFTGPTYSSGTTYTAGQTFYYTSTAYGTPSNYYAAVGTPTAGYTPDANPTYFSMLTIPYVLYQYVVNMCYADWLEVEGQTAKAQAARSTAQMYLDNENDKQERQSGNIMPWRVSTHITSQQRGMGYQGQNFQPGTATIGN